MRQTITVLFIALVLVSTPFCGKKDLKATIAGEMGETVGGSEHYFALFAVGLVLFAITFSINFIADLFLRRARK